MDATKDLSLVRGESLYRGVSADERLSDQHIGHEDMRERDW